MKKKILIGIAAVAIFTIAFNNVRLGSYHRDGLNFINFKVNTAQAEGSAEDRCRLWCTPGYACVIVCANGWNYICYGVF